MHLQAQAVAGSVREMLPVTRRRDNSPRRSVNRLRRNAGTSGRTTGLVGAEHELMDSAQRSRRRTEGHRARQIRGVALDESAPIHDQPIAIGQRARTGHRVRQSAVGTAGHNRVEGNRIRPASEQPRHEARRRLTFGHAGVQIGEPAQKGRLGDGNGATHRSEFQRGLLHP